MLGSYKSYSDYVFKVGVPKNIDTAVDYMFTEDTELGLLAKFVEVMLNDINSTNLENKDGHISFWELAYRVIKENEMEDY